MSIRTRLTIWYAAILLVSLIIMAGVAHYELTEQAHILRHGLQHEEPVWEEVGEVILYYGLPTTLLLLGVGSLLIRKALRPIAALTGAAERIHAGNLAEQLPRSRNGDELDRLTYVFNQMTARLHASFQGIREFSLHASHELRTPLTVMHAELETSMRDNSLTASERDRCANLLDEIQRLTQIVDGLTFLTKADAGVLKLASEPVKFDELVRDACADARILGESRKIQVHLNKCPPVTVTGDRHRLRQLLLILTDNAIKYNQEAGSVTLSLEAEQGAALLSIANTGPGIPSEIAGRVFDRFFRGDPSHSQMVEGCGLGLSIAQGIVQSHGGQIRFHSQLHGLTTATVELPAAQPGGKGTRSVHQGEPSQSAHSLMEK